MKDTEIYQEYYNREIISITEFEGTKEEKIKECQRRIIEYGEMITVMHGRSAAAFNFIRNLSESLSAEKREELRLNDLSYIVHEVKAPRSVNPKKEEEKDLRSLAKLARKFMTNGKPDIEWARDFIKKGNVKDKEVLSEKVENLSKD